MLIHITTVILYILSIHLIVFKISNETVFSVVIYYWSSIYILKNQTFSVVAVCSNHIASLTVTGSDRLGTGLEYIVKLPELQYVFYFISFWYYYVK